MTSHVLFAALLSPSAPLCPQASNRTEQQWNALEAKLDVLMKLAVGKEVKKFV